MKSTLQQSETEVGPSLSLAPLSLLRNPPKPDSYVRSRRCTSTATPPLPTQTTLSTVWTETRSCDLNGRCRPRQGDYSLRVPMSPGCRSRRDRGRLDYCTRLLNTPHVYTSVSRLGKPPTPVTHCSALPRPCRRPPRGRDPLSLLLP